MADDDEESGGQGSGNSPKKKNKEKLLIGLGLVGLYFAYRSYKNSSAAASSAATTTDSTTTSSAPPVVDPTAALNTLSTEIGAIAQQQSANTSAIASWQSTPGPQGPQGPAGPAATLSSTYASGAGAYNFPNNSPIVGAVAASGSSGGIYETNAQGQVYALGGAQYYGGLNITGANNRVVSILPNQGGYTLVDAAGGTYNFGPNPGQAQTQVTDTSSVP